MSRPLNMSEVDWLKSEIERLQKGGGSEEVEQLRARVRELEDENARLKHRVESMRLDTLRE